MPNAFRRTLLVLLATAAPVAARAQTVACADSAGGDTTAVPVRIVASVSASEVTFRSQPDASARAGSCGGVAVRVLERRNLPARVEPGVTYRDVHVAVEIVGRLEAACIAALAGGAGLDAALGDGPCARAGVVARPPP